jgi:hypothetical protein
MRDVHWVSMMWSKGELLWSEVSHHDASTVRTLPTLEPCFRTYHYNAEQSFPLLLEYTFSWQDTFYELPRT